MRFSAVGIFILPGSALDAAVPECEEEEEGKSAALSKAIAVMVDSTLE